MTHDDPQLREAISGLPAPGEGPPASEILSRARTRRRRPWPVYGAGALLLAAAAALFVLPGQGVRDKGASAVLAVHLEAAADSPGGARALAPGAQVQPHEGVVFVMHTQGEGTLSLLEAGDPVWGPVKVQAGTHGPGGSSPQAWRPQSQTSTLQYTAWLCPEGLSPGAPACTSDQLELVWLR